MKIKYSFLKNFLDTKLSQNRLVDVFTKVGFECESDQDLIEFDITPNRGDVLSLKGLEREFNAYQAKKSKRKLEITKLSSIKDRKIISQIDDSGCGNYHLMLIEGLQKIKDLDSKKLNFIDSAGIPLIHPLVDLGNYVMLEIGAPMHVFDLDKLDLPINVQFPKSNNNSLEVIGGDLKDIQSSSLTIQDQSGIQAVAGIIGSEKSAVSTNTANIAVEAAFFKPEIIANQARKYGLSTDASHRFERGVDPEIQQLALERYLFLLNEIAVYESVELYHSQSKKTKKKNVRLDIKRFNNFSGLNMKASQASSILKNLGFDIVTKSSKSLLFNIPSHRFDISLEEDLYEELLRSYGYDNIPISTPKAGPIIKNKRHDVSDKLRIGLVHAGFKELMHIPFVSKESFQQLNSQDWAAAELQNPINENEPCLRGSLFRSLFSAVNNNVKKGYSCIKVFEVGNVFKKKNKDFAQSLHLSGIIYFHELHQGWNKKKIIYDFFSLKAEVSKLLQTLGIQNAEFHKARSLSPFNENALDIFLGKQKIGVIGEIDLSITEKLIKKTTYGFEIYPEKFSLPFMNPKIKKTSKFPLSTRDINIVVDKSLVYHDVEKVMSKEAIKNLKSFHLVNTFEGKDIPEGFLSITLRFTFQNNTKSLLESEINKSMQMILKLLEKRLNAKIRS